MDRRVILTGRPNLSKHLAQSVCGLLLLMHHEAKAKEEGERNADFDELSPVAR
jgi:hypothetical protein